MESTTAFNPHPVLVAPPVFSPSQNTTQNSVYLSHSHSSPIAHSNNFPACLKKRKRSLSPVEDSMEIEESPPSHAIQKLNNSIQQVCEKNLTPLTISTININGNFSGKIQQINQWLQSTSIDILILTETKIHQFQHNKFQFLFPDYHLFTNNSQSNNPKHGIAVLVSNQFIDQVEVHNKIPARTIEIEITIHQTYCYWQCMPQHNKVKKISFGTQ
jgi:hypothetical protein